MLVNNYVLDPAHISPSRSDSASNGHFPFSAGHMPTGTPRGFNLANMQFFGNGVGTSFQGIPGGPPGFNGFMNGAGNWTPGMPGAGDPTGLHNPGVIRRGRQSTRSGPYDRRPGRYGGGGMSSGRLSPRGMYGASGRMPPGLSPYVPPGHPAAAAMAAALGGGRNWDNGAGGTQAMGPREAVQGRSLKSYEDLDAVGGSGSGELDY